MEIGIFKQNNLFKIAFFENPSRASLKNPALN